MREEYTVGNTTNKITLEVKIGAGGRHKTTITLFPRDGDSRILKESDGHFGSIDETYIGTAGELIGGYIRIETNCDFRYELPESFARLGNAINRDYFLKGGSSGNKSYRGWPNERSHINVGEVVICNKYIDFV